MHAAGLVFGVYFVNYGKSKINEVNEFIFE